MIAFGASFILSVIEGGLPKLSSKLEVGALNRTNPQSLIVTAGDNKTSETWSGCKTAGLILHHVLVPDLDSSLLMCA